MRACWMFMILLSCRLSHATTSKCTCNKIKSICAPVGNSVLVPCPQLTGEEVTFDLFKNEQVIYNHSTFLREKNDTNCKQRRRTEGVELHENAENKSVSFMLTRLDASSFGLYRCESKRMFPPPFEKANSSWIVISVEGYHCNLYKEGDTAKTAADQKDGFLWIWILGVALLGVYSLTVTIIAGIIWVKWKESDSQSDYMNTKPKAPRDRKKKRGVQIPVPHYF